jgi:NaMN:DMB phosphoribosyltransferase
VLIDGPVAIAAALLARDLGSQSRLWLLMPDHGDHPTVKSAADVLGLEPLINLKSDLGEGTAALLSLPLLRAGLHLSQSLPTRPPVLSAPPGFAEV